MTNRSASDDFNFRNLSFERIRRYGNDLAAFLKDANGEDMVLTRDMFLSKDAFNRDVPPPLFQARGALMAETRELLCDYLLGKHGIRWLYAQELEKDLFALTFHRSRNAFDTGTLQLIVTADEIHDTMLGLQLEYQRLLETDGDDRLFCMINTNNAVLNAAIYPGSTHGYLRGDRVDRKPPPREKLLIV